MILSHRRQKAVKLLSELDLDALIFCSPANLYYLCGFKGTDGALVVTPDQLVFLTDSRYVTQALEEVTADSIIEYKSKIDGVTDNLTALSVTRVGFESDLSYGTFKKLEAKGDSNWQWIDLKDEIQSLRLHKSAEEVSQMVAAAEINLAGFTDVESTLKVGARESDIALALEFAMRKRGADEKAFDIIVASGLRGALPHGVASGKIIAEGELVTIDFGCRHSGYHSDETITLAVGDISDKLREIFDTVLDAHDRALAAVAPGVALSEIDRIARDHIGACGYADYFGHGLGHGVGLEIHEAPVLSPHSRLTAEPGMVFTIEPGVYVPGIGGVRIEDMVLVTAIGRQVLTKIPKTFRNILLN